MANGKFADESCISDQLRSVGLSVDEVNTCMGDNAADSDSDLLEVHNIPFPLQKRLDARSSRLFLWRHLQIRTGSGTILKVRK